MTSSPTTQPRSAVRPSSDPQPAGPPFSGGRRRVLVVLFLVQLVLLTWLVVWKLQLPHIGWDETRHLKLVPFIASEGYSATKPLEFLANIAIFLPFGAYLALLLPARLWPVTFFAAGFASLGMESAQYVLAVGSFDVTDIIGNTAGAMLGLIIMLAAGRAVRANRGAVLGWCAAFTVAAVVLVGMLYASPVGPWSAGVADLASEALG